MKRRKERRHAILRRQVNQSFCDPDGGIAIAKIIAVAGQISAIYHFNVNFTALMLNWDSLFVILAVIVMPDVLKKIITMKYGNGNAAK